MCELKKTLEIFLVFSSIIYCWHIWLKLVLLLTSFVGPFLVFLLSILWCCQTCCFFDEITMLTPKYMGRLKVFGSLFVFLSFCLSTLECRCFLMPFVSFLSFCSTIQLLRSHKQRIGWDIEMRKKKKKKKKKKEKKSAVSQLIEKEKKEGKEESVLSFFFSHVFCFSICTQKSIFSPKFITWISSLLGFKEKNLGIMIAYSLDLTGVHVF